MKKIFLFLLFLFFIISCTEPIFLKQVEENDFKQYLGKIITLEGKTVNAKLGALLVGENFSIWIDGLDSWPKAYYKGGEEAKKVKVTGRVIEKYDLPVFIPKEGEMLSGIPVPEGTDLKEASHRYLLKNVKWTFIVE